MIMEFVEYLVVMGLSAFKVMVGAMAAIKFDMSITEIFLTVALGGTIGVVLYAYLGNEIRSFFSRRKRANGITLPTASRIKRLRMIIRIWKKLKSD